MKMQSAVAFIGVLLFVACCGPSKKNIPQKLSSIPIRIGMWDSTVLKPYDTAKRDIAYYDTICRRILNRAEPPIEYFTVRATDLLAAMGIDTLYARNAAEYNHRYVRVTIGFSQADTAFKLYIQPVLHANLGPSGAISAGIPLYFRHNGVIDSTERDLIVSTNPTDSLYVADLNAPCPRTCGSSSTIKRQ